MSSSELPEYAVRNRARWTKTERGVLARPRPRVPGARRRSRWGLWGVPEAELNALPRRRRQGRRRARLRHRLLLRLAGPARCAAGRRRRHARSARDGSAAARPRPGSSSRCSRRTRRTCRCRTPPSTWRSRSTARRSGATPTAGSRRRRGCSGPAASSSSCATRRSRCSAAGARRLARDAAAAAARAATGSTGRTTGRPSSTCRSASCFALLRENGFDVLELKELLRARGRGEGRVLPLGSRVGEALAVRRRSGGRGSGERRTSSIRSCSRRRALSAA